MFPSIVSLVCAVIASFVIGMTWYSPLLFGPLWLKLKQFDKKTSKNAQRALFIGYFTTLVGTILQALVLYQILYVYRATTLSQTICVTITMWFGFIAVTQLSMMMFDNKKFNVQLFVIDTSYQLVSLLFMGILLRLFN